MTSFRATLLTAMAFAIVLASSADAASARKHRQQAAAPTKVTVDSQYRGANLFPPGPIYYGIKYLGDDPDPFIRLQLWRDLGAPMGGNY